MFRTPYNFSLTSEDMEVNTLPSLAVPDQSLSVREIFERYRTGAPLDIVSRYSSDLETDFDDLSCVDDPSCDLVDVYEEIELMQEKSRDRRQRNEALAESQPVSHDPASTPTDTPVDE